MSFFDNPEYQDIILNIGINESISPIINYPIGSIVVYCRTDRSFTFFPPTFNMLINEEQYMPVGIVLELLSDLSYIVMYKGFLNSDRLPLMDNLQLSRLGTNGTKYIASAVANEFKRYINQLKNACNIKALTSLEFLLPSNRHMDLIMYNTENIINNLAKIIGEDKAEKFYNKLIKERIYCNISGYIAEWKVPKNNAEFYSEPGLVGGYFLPIIQIKLK